MVNLLVLSLSIVLLSFVAGGFPVGQAVLARVGLVACLNSAHNLGISNLLFRAGSGIKGLRVVLAASLPDVLKGFLTVLLTSTLGLPAVTITAGLAAYLGHLYAPRVLYGPTPR